ncbi:MAG: mechanosensitive ion channel family protein [Bryobacteraceae bacterium]
MGTAQNYLTQNWQMFITPLCIFFVVFGLGFLARRLLFRMLEGWAEKSKTKFDDILIVALRKPFIIWVLLLAVHLATQSSQLPARPAALIAKVLLVLWIISFTVVASKLAALFTRAYGQGLSSALPVTTLTQNIASLVVAMFGILILLNALGISITPILTALGVGGLAVALALQDTLSNLFSGFYISVAGQVRPGDYVKLDGGQEGYVTDISWRSTTLRALANNLIVVPNAKLAQAIVTNYHLPEKRMSLLIPVSVSYDNDPDVIEKVLVEEALLGAKTIPGLLAEPAPFVRFIPGFGSSSIDFTLICQVSEFVDQYLAQHELRKRIFKRFRRDGIEIPFPIQTVYLKRTHQADSSHKIPAPGVHSAQLENRYAERSH